jgi:hypothetical protein
VDDFKVFTPRAGDNTHAHLAVQPAQDLAGAGNDRRAGAQQLGVAGVTRGLVDSSVAASIACSAAILDRPSLFLRKRSIKRARLS